MKFSIFFFILLNLFLINFLVIAEEQNKDNAFNSITDKIKKFKENSVARRYLSGALLGSALAVTTQPFRNAKDHFLVFNHDLFSFYFSKVTPLY